MHVAPNDEVAEHVADGFAAVVIRPRPLPRRLTGQGVNSLQAVALGGKRMLCIKIVDKPDLLSPIAV